jgi:hypothetical protein
MLPNKTRIALGPRRGGPSQSHSHSHSLLAERDGHVVASLIGFQSRTEDIFAGNVICHNVTYVDTYTRFMAFAKTRRWAGLRNLFKCKETAMVTTRRHPLASQQIAYTLLRFWCRMASFSTTPVAIRRMIVRHPHRLHPRIHNHRPHKLEAALLQIG